MAYKEDMKDDKKLIYKQKLTDMLWKSGFRFLLLGFLLLNFCIFSFFFIRINSLYDKITQYTVKIAKLSQEFIQEKEKNLMEDSAKIVSELNAVLNYHHKLAKYIISDNNSTEIKMQIKQNLQNQLNEILQQYSQKKALHGALIADSKGIIISKYGFDKYSFIDTELLKELNSLSIEQYKFAISEDGINFFQRLNTEYTTYLVLFKKMNVHIFQDFIQFQTLYSKTNLIKTDLYIFIILVFLALIALFLFFSLWIVRMLSKKIMTNLQTLLALTEKNKHNNDTFLLPDVQIQEFQDIIYVLYNNLQELHSVNKDLNEKNTLIQEILDNVSNGIILLNKKYKVLLINAKGAQMLNASQEKNPEIKINNIFPELIELLYEDEKNHNQDNYIIKNIDKNSNRFLVHVRKLQDRFLVTFEDITYQISLQKQAAWRDVARVIAHEVKNPLTPTRLCAEQLLYSNKLTEEKRNQYLQTIINNVEHVNKLINDFTDFTKQVQQNLQLSTFSLKELLKEIVEMQKLVFVNVKFEILTSKDLEITADQKQIMQAVSNLVQNAAQAFDENSQDACVSITYKIIENQCQIIVDDNGKGIEGDIEKIFQPYMTTKTYGTGLGLVVVKKIAQMHGGSVVLNKKEKGVQAIFSLKIN